MSFCVYRIIKIYKYICLRFVVVVLYLIKRLIGFLIGTKIAHSTDRVDEKKIRPLVNSRAHHICTSNKQPTV